MCIRDSLNYDAEVGNMLVVSSGGNFSNDNSALDFLKNGSDNNGSQLVPMFLDATNNDYRLTADSPMVDAGVATDAPNTDLNGNDRLGQVDVGAFEFQGETSSTQTISEDNENIHVSPNPAASTTILKLDDNWTGDFSLKILGTMGQLLSIQQFNKTSSGQQFEIDLEHLASGQFYLLINNGKQIFSKKLVKL